MPGLSYVNSKYTKKRLITKWILRVWKRRIHFCIPRNIWHLKIQYRHFNGKYPFKHSIFRPWRRCPRQSYLNNAINASMALDDSIIRSLRHAHCYCGRRKDHLQCLWVTMAIMINQNHVNYCMCICVRTLNCCDFRIQQNRVLRSSRWNSHTKMISKYLRKPQINRFPSGFPCGSLTMSGCMRKDLACGLRRDFTYHPFA